MKHRLTEAKGLNAAYIPGPEQQTQFRVNLRMTANLSHKASSPMETVIPPIVGLGHRDWALLFLLKEELNLMPLSGRRHSSSLHHSTAQHQSPYK